MSAHTAAPAGIGTATTRRQVFAWGLWDWGSAAFNAVILTFVFSVYLTDAVGDDLPGTVSASTWLGWALGIAGFVIAVTAPISGRVGRAIVTEGNLVSTGPGEATLLTTVVSLDPIYASFDADEQTFLRYGDLARAGTET